MKLKNKRRYWLPDNFLDSSHSEMSEDERNELRHYIKDKLAEFGLTQIWLIHHLRQANMITDKSEMSSILAGTRNGAKTETLLRMSKSILEVYAKFELTTQEEMSKWTS